MKNNNYIKANRRGSREADLENKTGFVATHKIHKSCKTYNRKNKKIDVWRNWLAQFSDTE